MLDPALVPTPLLRDGGRPSVVIGEPIRIRFRSLSVIRKLGFVVLEALWLKLRGQLTAERIGRSARRAVNELGGFWVKAAQIVSLRHDLYPVDFCFELMKVIDQAQGFSGEIARQVLEEEMGQPVEALLEDFDPKPLAAASIGQVHTATLKPEACRVAIKIQRPGIVESFLSDMRTVAVILWFVKRFHRLAGLRLDEVYLELNDMLEEELDYRREAFHIKAMRRLLAKQGVLAPRTWQKYNRRRVLFMEFFDCVFMSDYLALSKQDPARARSWLLENDIDPGKAGRALYQSYLRQILEGPYFHGDLHPGNIALLRNSEVGLIDFGAIGVIYRDFKRAMNRYMRSTAQRNAKETVERLMFLFEPVPPTDLDEFKRELQCVIRDWDANTRVAALPFHQKSVVYLYMEMGRVALKYSVPFDWAFMRVDRATITLNTTLAHLCPDLDIPREIKKYYRNAFRRKVWRNLDRPENLERTAVALKGFAEKMAEAGDNFHALLRRTALSYQASTSKTSYAFQVLLKTGRFALDLAAVLLVGIFLESWVGLSLLSRWSSRLHDMVRAFPPLGVLDWCLVGFVLLKFRRAFQEAVNVLARRETQE